MRLVCVADTHLFHDELVIPDGDVFVHAGDLCRSGSLDELAVAAQWIRGLPHRHKILVAGNHDWAFAEHAEHARALLTGIHYLQDTRISVEGRSFWGSPWQPAFNDWAFNLPRGEALAAKWALVPEGIDVLVTHGPPAGFGDHSSTSGRHGCDDLLRRVRDLRAKPKVHLFGHIHDDGGAWFDDGTWFVNCTTWECERAPTVIDLEDDTQAVRVDAPPARRRGTVPP